MRIAIWHNLPSGGGRRALHDQVRGLLRRGHHVEVWCPVTADRSYLPLDGLVAEHVLPLEWRDVTVEGSSLAEKARWALVDWRRNLSALDEHCHRCAQGIGHGGFDLLLAHSSRFMAVAPIARFVRLPRVLYLQEPLRMLYEAMPEWPWIPPRRPASWIRPKDLLDYAAGRVSRSYFQALAREESRNIRAYDRVLANSMFSRESLLRAYGVDARSCYLGVDAERFVPSRQGREDYLLGVGSFTPAKNIEFVIRSVARLRPPRPPLVWVGNSASVAYLEGLKRLAASLDVAFEPRKMVSEAALVDLLGRAAVLVYAPRLEPFGYAPLEANACGTPVVAVAEGGVRETVIDGVNGLVVEPDETAFAAAVDRLTDDSALARSLGEAGRRLVAERWSLDAAAERLDRHLVEALRRGSRSA